MKQAYLSFTENKPIYDQNLYGDHPGKTIYEEIKSLINKRV
jgi:hypothetical protein